MFRLTHRDRQQLLITAPALKRRMLRLTHRDQHQPVWRTRFHRLHLCAVIQLFLAYVGSHAKSMSPLYDLSVTP